MTSWDRRKWILLGGGSTDHDNSSVVSCDLGKSYELTLHLEDGDDEDLIRKKDKKKKTLGLIIIRLTLSPLSKEEYNEVTTGCARVSSLCLSTLFLGTLSLLNSV